MKRGWKIFWITCAVMAAVGIVCCILAVMLGVTTKAIAERCEDSVGSKIGISFQDEDDEYYNASVIAGDTSNSYTGITQIDADLYAGEVYIKEADDDRITVETAGLNSKLKFRCVQDGDTLKLVTKKRVIHVNNTGTITIYVPRDKILEDVSLDLAAGSLYIEDVRARELDIDIGAGEAVIEHFEAVEVDVSCGAGMITLKGQAESSVGIECGTGEVNYYTSGSQNDYNYNIESGIGEINVGDREFSGLAQECYIDNAAHKDIDIECGIGEVNVCFNN